MKTAHDPRHLRRIKAVKALFSYTFHPEQETSSKLAQKVASQQDNIDQIITQCAPNGLFPQINRIRPVCSSPSLFTKCKQERHSTKVIIDEAIEIGKRYGSQSSGSFINGVLASALKATNRDQDIDQSSNPEKLSDESTPDHDEPQS